MNKPLITIALLVLTLSFTIPFNMHDVYAQSEIVRSADINLGGANNKVFAMDGMDLFVAVSTVTGQNQNAMSYIRSDVLSPSVRTIQIQPYVGGCNAVDNPCGNDSAGLEIFGDIETADDSNWIGSAQGLWCGLTDCFTWWISGNSSYSHQLQRYTIESQSDTFQLSGYMNVTYGSNPKGVITGIDTATGGIGGITVITIRQPVGSVKIFFTGGTSLMGDVGTEITLASGTDINEMATCHPAIHDNCSVSTVATAYDHGTTDRFHTWNIGTHAEICSNTANSYVNSGSIIYNDDDGRFYVSEDLNNRIVSFNQACSETIIATAIYQNYVRGIAMNPLEDNYFVYHSSTTALPIVTAMDYTVKTNTEDFDATTGDSINGWVSGNNAPYQSMALDNEFQSLMLTGDTSSARIIYLTTFIEIETGGGVGTISGIDCDLPANEHKLICALGQDGAISGSAGAFVIGSIEDGTGLLGLGCNIGLVDCIADDNSQTNGLGLLIFIGSIFVVIGMFFYTIGKDAFHMPIFIWVVIIIALSAFFTITGLIDPVFLIVSIIAIVALAVPKIMTVVRGNSSFGGGSTE